MLTVKAMSAAGVDRATAESFIGPLTIAMARFRIDETPRRVAAFIGRMAHESTGFTRMEEGLHYKDPVRIAKFFRTAFDLDRDGVVDPEEVEFARAYVGKPQKLANRAYANRNGNGDESSGDGWLYRGRGPTQLTFRGNYMAAGLALGVDYKTNPDLVATPTHGSLVAGWFWDMRKLNPLADAWDLPMITEKINGKARLGLEDTAKRSNSMLKVLLAS